MTNAILIHRTKDTGGQRHSGYRTYRNFELRVNGMLWETYRDDSAITQYACDDRLDELIMFEAHRIQRFFGGTISKTSIKDTNEVEAV